MSPFVSVEICILAGVRESEDSRNFEPLVLRVLTLGDGALCHADLEGPPLLGKKEWPFFCSLSRRRVIGGTGIVIVHRFGCPRATP